MIIPTRPLLYLSFFLSLFSNYLSFFLSFLFSLSLLFSKNVAFFPSLGTRKNVDCSLLTGFMETFQTKEFYKNIKFSSLNTKRFLKWFLGADRASLQQVAGVLRTKVQSQKAHSFSSIFAVTDPLLLHVAGTEQVCSVLWAPKAVQTYAVSDNGPIGWFFLSAPTERSFSGVLE